MLTFLKTVISIIVGLFIFAFSLVFAGKCPKPEVIYPCVCKYYEAAHARTSEVLKGNAIYCGGEKPYNLRQIFIDLSDTLNSEDKHFAMFNLKNTAISKLEKDVFHD